MILTKEQCEKIRVGTAIRLDWSITDLLDSVAALQEERDVLAQGYIAPDAELIAILSPLSVKNVPTSVIELTKKAMAQIAALQSERDALREMITVGSQGRCMVCYWPLKKSASEGCVPGNCSYRPNEHSPEYEGWLKRAKLIYELCSTPASGEPARKLCPDCKHSLEDNNHGFDQNDGFLDEHGELVHRGHCTYCRICNPHIFETVRKP